MPEIGEIKRAREIEKTGSGKYTWLSCPTCQKQRWVALRKGQPISSLCFSCNVKVAGKNNRKGERHKHSGGYIYIFVQPNDFFYPMADSHRYIFEHRLVMAKSLSRCLQSWELVHHKNGIKDDNRLENLELMTKGAHITEHGKGYQDGYQKGLADGMTKQIRGLKEVIVNQTQEIKLLQGQIKELNTHMEGICH